MTGEDGMERQGETVLWRPKNGFPLHPLPRKPAFCTFHENHCCFPSEKLNGGMMDEGAKERFPPAPPSKKAGLLHFS